MADDRLARWVAISIVVVFIVAELASLADPQSRKVPAELWPLVVMALGYLLGYRVMKGNGDGGGR